MKRFWQLANIVTLLFALVANFLVGAQLIGLPAINDISDKYATYLTPAGYAFSIWSLIYVLLVVFVVYQARDLFKQKKENTLPQQVGPFFAIASICNGLWTYLFVNELIGLSVVTLLVLTASLYVLLWRLKIATVTPNLKTAAFVWWPLMIYSGWVTAASIVNIASWLAYHDIILQPWVASVILVSLGVALVFILMRRNVRELVLACVWAIIAIGVQQLQLESGSAVVASVAFFVTGALLAITAIHGYTNRQNFFTT